MNCLLSDDHKIVTRSRKQESRLQPRRPKVARPKCAPPRSRDGDYEPPFETYHIRELQLIKQVRRIQALVRRLSKCEHHASQPHVMRQNAQEWLAITQNKAFKPCFSAWSFRNHLVTMWFHDVPPSWWLDTLYHSLKHVADDMVLRSREAKRKHFKFKVNVDMLHFGGSLASAVIKERNALLPVAFEVDTAVTATLLRTQGKGAPLIQVSDHHKIVPQYPVQVADVNLKLKETNVPDVFAVPGMPTSEDAREAAIICKLRTLGALFATQQEHWEGHEEWITGNCPLCGKPDNRQHIPFQCHGVLDLRREHSRTLERITQEYPHSCFLPVVHKHPKQSILSHLHYMREMPQCFNLDEFSFPCGVTPTFYTDGSAAFPALGGQLAAWAIVLDLCHSDDQRRQSVAALSDMKLTPPTLHPIQISLAAGAQTINRAELQAILQIVRATEAANIFTDSAWAMNIFEEVRSNPDPNFYWAREHSDILHELCRLAEIKDLYAFNLFKIKSHQVVATIDDPIQVYHVMGNRFADELAKRATTRDQSDLHKFCWEVAEWYQCQIELVQAVQPFLAKAEIQRLDGLQQQTPNPDLAVQEAFTMEHAILWQPTHTYVIPGFEPSDKLLEAFQPCPGALLQVIQWAGTLKWPDEDTISGGISWYELLVNFLLITQCRIPVMVERKIQHPQFRDFHIHADAVMFPQTVWDCVRFLENSFQYIKRFTGRELVPLAKPLKRWFLSGYGYQKRIGGLPIRPVLPKQLQHIAVLKTVVTADELLLPDCNDQECWFPRRVLAADHLSHRQRYLNHRSLMHHVKKHGAIPF
eukprot:Skav231606  [mRNA]  locus=scaffold232:492039:496256:+ [translate_table: standard]